MKSELDFIYVAGLLHDVGLTVVPVDSFKNSDHLSPAERSRIEQHPVIGAKIMANLDCLKQVLPIIRHHHEAHDGSGYPDGLKGADIPFGARLISLFNHFDNLAFPPSANQRASVEFSLYFFLLSFK